MQFPVVLTFFESDISNVQFARLMQHSEHVFLLQRSANTFSASEGYRNHYRVLVSCCDPCAPFDLKLDLIKASWET